MTFLRLEQVTRQIRLPDAPPLHILEGIDLEIEAGDHVSIVGRSGSGKSTLLNILGLLDQPTTGRMTFDDQAIALVPPRRRDRLRAANVGFIFQQFNLIEGLTALENVQMPLLYGAGARFWRREALGRAMLDRVSLLHRATAPVTTLSGGEQQRVAIARALVRRPRLILADEPTGALDLETGVQIMELVEEIAAESSAALVTITHDVNVAARARTMYRLDRGRLARAERVAA